MFVSAKSNKLFKILCASFDDLTNRRNFFLFVANISMCYVSAGLDYNILRWYLPINNSTYCALRTPQYEFNRRIIRAYFINYYIWSIDLVGSHRVIAGKKFLSSSISVKNGENSIEIVKCIRQLSSYINTDLIKLTIKVQHLFFGLILSIFGLQWYQKIKNCILLYFYLQFS